MSPVSESQKFARSTKLKQAGKVLDLTGNLPGDGLSKGQEANLSVTALDPNHKKSIKLVRKLAEGGEGSVFTTNVKGYVAKIYKRDKITEDRKDKLKIMISKPIECEGVCFPEAIILNDQDEFVGYLMKEAKGFELATSVFKPKLLIQKFPNWTRKDTIQLCLTILEKIQYLNERNVIMGDINPANILVVSPTEVFFVDCDSYQIEGYPCPVGTDYFTPPEALGKDFKTFLRTQEMENFAIATLLFMIMLPGKPPYSAVGGESPVKNIKSGNFPYPHSDEDGSNMPPGHWGNIWSHMSFRVREAFFETFKKDEAHYSPSKRYGTKDWIDLFGGYQHGEKYMLKADPMAMDIFPTRQKMRKCRKPGCEEYFVPNDRNWSYCPKHGGVATKQCKNPKCSNTIPANRSGDYCQSCWADTPCTKCGYIAAKWMHDERGGLCRKCYEESKRVVSSRSYSAISSYTDHKGKSYASKAAMCAAWNVNPSTYDSRIKRGWSVERALTEPVTSPQGTSYKSQTTTSKISSYGNSGKSSNSSSSSKSSSSSSKSSNSLQTQQTNEKKSGIGCFTVLAALFAFAGIWGEFYWLTNRGQFDSFDAVWALIGIAAVVFCYSRKL